MVKIDRNGQAKVLTQEEITIIRHSFLKPKHRLIFDIAVFTGERYGAIVKLRQDDVYFSFGKVRPEITFRWHSRKQSAGKRAKTRQVPIHEKLKKYLEEYDRPSGDWMFPNVTGGETHVTMRTASFSLQIALKRCRLDGLGITTHSPRRTFATTLHKQGVSIETIAQLTGHSSIEQLKRYIDIYEDDKCHALSRLPF